MPAIASIITPCSGSRTGSDPHAQRSFKVFERLAASNLAGLFERDLWQEVLRASQHSNTIWYAATAIGFAHKAYLQRSFDLQTIDEDRALKQYNKAIRSLTRPDVFEEEPEIIMAASILFMAFEVCRYIPLLNASEIIRC